MLQFYGGRLSRFFVALVISLQLVACGGTETDPAYDTAIQQYDDALKELQLGNYEVAELAFAKLVNADQQSADEFVALEGNDLDTLNKARFGYFLAHSLNTANEWVESLEAIISLVNSFAPGLTPQQAINEFVAMGGADGGLIPRFVKNFSDFFEGTRAFLEPIKEQEDFNLVLTQLPIKFGSLPTIIELPGEYDLGEVYLFDSLFQFGAGSLKTITGINLNVETGILTGQLSLDYILERIDAIGAEGDDGEDIVSAVANLVAVALHRLPVFLTIADTQAIQSSGELFVASFEDLGNALEFMKSEVETDSDQSDDIVGYIPVGADDGPFLEFHIEPGGVLDLIPGVDADALKAFRVEINENIVAAIDNFEASFANEAGARISWAKDIVPVLSVVVISVLKSGLVAGLIEAALNDAGDAADSVRSLIQSDFLSTELLESVILSVIPDIFEFDIGEFFTQPTAPRTWLPFWTVPLKTNLANDDFEEFKDIRLLLEFECDDQDGDLYDAPRSGPTADSYEISCNEPNESVDIDHFTSESVFTRRFGPTDTTAAETNFRTKHAAYLDNLRFLPDPNALGLIADGIESSVFYFPLQDPTLGNVLYIRLPLELFDPSGSPIASDCPISASQFDLANNLCLAALMNKIIGGLVDLI